MLRKRMGLRVILVSALLVTSMLFTACGSTLQDACDGLDPIAVCNQCGDDVWDDCNDAAAYTVDKLDNGYLKKEEKKALCESFRNLWYPICTGE